jgi:hypothetical protein
MFGARQWWLFLRLVVCQENLHILLHSFDAGAMERLNGS